MTTSATSLPKTSISYIWRSSKTLLYDSNVSFASKTILITGANTGLGFAAALKYASLGASSIIFGVRSLDRGRAAKAQIEQATKCSPDLIKLFLLDMTSFASVECFVRDVEAVITKIDIAVMNAGITLPTYELSSDGWEITLQVMVLSTAYLSLLLLPILRSTAAQTQQPSCLEFVASTGHADVSVGNIDGKDGVLAKLNDKASYSLGQYINTKLLQMWLMHQIADRVPASEVVVLACCPGLCKTNIGRDFGGVLKFVDAMFKNVFARTAEEGSRTIVSGTTLGEKGHGGFWTNDMLSAEGKLVKTEEGKQLSNKFWDELLIVLMKRNPEALRSWKA